MSHDVCPLTQCTRLGMFIVFILNNIITGRVARLLSELLMRALVSLP